MTGFQSSLCNVCQDALDQAFNNFRGEVTGEVIPHHPTKDSLVDSVLAQSCHLCRLIVDHIEALWTGPPPSPEAEEGPAPGQTVVTALPPEDDVRASDFESTNLLRDRLWLHRAVGHLPEDIGLTARIFFQNADLRSDPVGILDIGHKASAGSHPSFSIRGGFSLLTSSSFAELTELARHHVIDETTRASSCQKLAVNWLDRCNKHHEACTEWQGTFRPTRLLDLASVDTTGKVRLVLSEECQQDEPYVTLSHCWGSTMSFRLTTETFETIRVGIDLEDLPRTFRDAIEIAGWFQEASAFLLLMDLFKKVRYLWIDSCCILQDSKDDWLREAKTMGKVYKNTYFNISADHSTNTSGGCFIERLAHKVVPCRYEAPDIGWVNLIAEETFMKGLDNSALSERAWVVQERFLSPRVLHFTADQLFWECAGLFACESFADGLPPHYDHNSSWHYRANSSLESSARPDEPYFYDMWNRICEGYSFGDLTHLSDKLIAFSGVVAEFQSRVPHDEYLAGIWKDDIVSGLLWHVVGQGGIPVQANGSGPKRDGALSASPTPVFRAPSWSWLSIDCKGIVCSTGNNFPIIQILKATVDLVDDDEPSGEVRGGSIVVRGLLRSARWKREYGVDTVILDGKHEDQFGKVPGDPQPADSFNITRDTGSMLPVNEIFCLLMSRWAPTEIAAEMIDGLVLRATDAKDTFQRIGYFGTLGLLPCMAAKYKLCPLAREMDRPWDRFIPPHLGAKENGAFSDSTADSDGSVENDAEAGSADAELGWQEEDGYLDSTADSDGSVENENDAEAGSADAELGWQEEDGYLDSTADSNGSAENDAEVGSADAESGWPVPHLPPSLQEEDEYRDSTDASDGSVENDAEVGSADAEPRWRAPHLTSSPQDEDASPQEEDEYLDSTADSDGSVEYEASPADAESGEDGYRDWTDASDDSIEDLPSPADAYLGDAPYDETLFERLEERTIILI